MKENIRKGLKRNKGITLIALIITIIVLLILAGVTISLTLGNNGIFKTATNAVEEHIIAEQKEELERAILNIKMNKIAQGKTIQISDLNELNNDTFQVEDTSAFPVIAKSTKYEFQIDDEYKVTYIGPANGLRVTYTLNTKDWTKEDVIITLNPTSEKGTIGEINTPAGLTKNADGTYTASENGTYKFIVKDNLNNQKEIEVKISNIDKIEPLDFTPATKNVTGTGFTITVEAEDNEGGSGILKYECYIRKKGTTDDYSKHESTDGIFDLEELDVFTLYEYYIIALDKAKNPKTTEILEQETLKESKKIYVEVNTGNDETGDGTKAKPFKTLEGFIQKGVASGLDEYDVRLGDGEYALPSALYTTGSFHVVITGNKEATVLVSPGAFGNTYGSGACIVGTLEFRRLVWKGDANCYNFHCLRCDVSFCNVVFDVAGSNKIYSYFFPLEGATHTFRNCTTVGVRTEFFRCTDGYVKLYNCYGGFTSGHGTSESDWNISNNHITLSPSVNSTTYRITDEESVWKGKGFDEDGNVTDLGVYGGKYSWEN